MEHPRNSAELHDQIKVIGGDSEHNEEYENSQEY